MHLIEFDGGTSCNVPALGYGVGYGSYRIDGNQIVRLDHRLPMSANAAEILTLACALESISVEHYQQSIEVIGDSQIALSWLKKPKLLSSPSPKTSPEFQVAVRRLQSIAIRFFAIHPIWKARAHSVAIFGH